MNANEYINGMADLIRTTGADVRIEDIDGKKRITVRDYSDYDSNLCHDGGHYATGVTFIRHADGWERREYTSGDYCPYCGSFDCCGDCEEAEAAESERLTDAEVMDEVNHYKGQADTAIMYQPA